MVQDMPRQRAFHKRNFSEVPAPYNDRLQALQHDGGTTRLYRGVESMKMRLSEHDASRHALDYIDDGAVGQRQPRGPAHGQRGFPRAPGAACCRKSAIRWSRRRTAYS